MSTFVLVHGAWHGGWCWEKLTPILEASGHRVVTPDLPGRGPESQPLSGLTLDDYADFLSFTLAALPLPFDRVCFFLPCLSRLIVFQHNCGSR